ncbi:Alpha/Beta hydrolase protein [Mycena sp. CBHHK59/15]|nr:Alpha/Beta hydrolase protein [Mycena sp. CBHHK59/15]
MGLPRPLTVVLHAPAMSNSQEGILVRVPSVLIYFGITYGIVLALILVPFVQTHLVYGHHRGFSSIPNFSSLEDYGLAPGKTVNLYIKSADNTTLGAWFVMSEKYYHSLSFPVKAIDIPAALKKRPTILFLHGKTGHRAVPLRVPIYAAFSSRLDANVFAVDYRGFGDSEGQPTLAGVAADARAAWDYLTTLGAEPKDVLIVGHSLGTCVAGLLAAELSQEGISPRGLVLLAPFASVKTLMYEYYLFGFLPLLKPLVRVPTVSRFVTGLLTHRFDTLNLVPKIAGSVLIAHAEDDRAVPHAHADTLFNAFIDPLLPATPIQFDGKDLAAQQADMRKELVTVLKIPAFGKLEETQRGGHRFALLKTAKGTHDIGRVEGVQDVIGRMFGFL